MSSTADNEKDTTLAYWILNEYYPQLTGLLETAMSYLHNGVHWGLASFTGVIFAIVLRNSFPDEITWWLLWLAIPILVHFATRAGKGYINVMRWSTLQRHIINYIGNANQNQNSVEQLIGKIDLYHVKWYCPITSCSVFVKVLFGQGYFYFLFIVGFLICFTAFKIAISGYLFLPIILSVALILFELVLFLKSNYLKNIHTDPLAMDLR